VNHETCNNYRNSICFSKFLILSSAIDYRYNMKPQSCRNCGKELWQNQRVCPHCGQDRGQDDPE